MDISIQGAMDGIETATRVGAHYTIPVIYLTAYSEDATLERAQATRPYGYLLKPFSERELHATIQMALARRESEAAQQVSEERLALALDAAEMGIWEVDPGSRRVTVSPRAREIFGLTEDCGETTWSALLQAVAPAYRHVVNEELERRLSGASYGRLEFVSADGKRWMRIQGRRFPTARAGRDRIIGVVQDITEEKRIERELRELNDELERRVADRTIELRESISELDAFSYSVAHDLRAPVRGIVGYSQILLEEFGDAITGQGRHYLERMRTVGLHMGRMIDALLALSRLNRIELQRRPVNLSLMANQLLQDMRDAEPGRKVEAIIASGLEARADSELAKLVLDNLLRNAWKFTSRQNSVARIEFGATVQDGEQVFYVRDNGAGFDMRYANKLFSAFERLHRPDEFGGTGVGLTIVYRIVRRHGGRVWAEAEEGKGATFYFTLEGLPVRLQ
jgi:PAS domain S-box-containing protein